MIALKNSFCSKKYWNVGLCEYMYYIGISSGNKDQKKKKINVYSTWSVK